MTVSLAAFSASIARIVELGAPLLTAIRVGPNRHVTGLLCPGGIVVTPDQTLPVIDAYSIVLPNRSLIPGRPGARNTEANLAVVQLEAAIPVSPPETSIASLGGLAVLLGTDSDASPTVRLTVVHRYLRTADGPAAVLDLQAAATDTGSLAFDADGRLFGIVSVGPAGETIAVPVSAISRTIQFNLAGSSYAPPAEAYAAPYVPSMPPPAPSSSYAAPRSARRGWLGIALQPITIPDQLIARAGQSSGRMVVNITNGGPAARAGLRINDVLLSMNGVSVSGQHGLRDFLAEERIGSTVEVRLLRDGNPMTAQLLITAQT